MQHGRRASAPMQTARTVPALPLDRESSGSEKGDDESSLGGSDKEDVFSPDTSPAVNSSRKGKDLKSLFRHTVQTKLQAANLIRQRRRASVDTATLHAKEEAVCAEAGASEEKREFEGTAAWIARLQSNEEVISRKKECCRAQVSMLEVALPAVAALPASTKMRLLSDMEQEIDGIMQVMARQAYISAREDWKQNEAMKQELRDMEERTASCHKMYLREMSDARDKKRESARLLVNDVNEVAVHLYEPLQCLSEEVRSLTMNIIDERLKAIFDFNPAMQEKANAVEVARLEFQVAKDRLCSAEKTTRNLQEKVVQLQDRLSRQDKRAEKAEWELSSQRAEMFNLKQEHEQRINEIRTDLQLENEARIEFERNKAQNLQERLEKLRLEVDRYAADNKTLRDTVTSSQGSQRVTPTNVNLDVSTPSRRASVTPRPRHGSELWKVVRQKRGEVLETAKRERNLARPSETRGRGRYESEALLDSKSANRFLSGFGSMDSQGQIQDLTMKLTLRDEHVTQLELQLEKTRREIEAFKKMGKWEGAQELLAENERLSEEMKQIRHDAQLATTAVDCLRLELGKEKQETRKAEAQRASLAAERAKEMKNRASQAQELRDLKALLAATSARSESLQASLQSAECQKNGNLCSQRAKALMEDKIKDLMNERQKDMQEKVVVAREQVTNVLQENQVLRLALQEVTEVNGRLTDTLKEFKPEEETVSPSIDEVLTRTEVMVREHGAGKYIRLYQDGLLRDVASLKLKEVRDTEDISRQQRIPAQAKSVNVDIEAPELQRPPSERASMPERGSMSARLSKNRPPSMTVPSRPSPSQSSDVCPAIDAGPSSPVVYMPKRVIGKQNSISLPKVPCSSNGSSRSGSRSPHNFSDAQNGFVISPKVEVKGSLLCGAGGMLLTSSTCLQSPSV